MVIGTPIGIAISDFMAEAIGVETYFLLPGLGLTIVALGSICLSIKNFNY